MAGVQVVTAGAGRLVCFMRCSRDNAALALSAMQPPGCASGMQSLRKASQSGTDNNGAKASSRYDVIILAPASMLHVMYADRYRMASYDVQVPQTQIMPIPYWSGQMPEGRIAHTIETKDVIACLPQGLQKPVPNIAACMQQF